MKWGPKGTKKYRKAYRQWLKTPVGRTYRLQSTLRQIQRHRIWIENYKLAQGCQSCGFNRWPECLDFDHLDPKTKKFDISHKLQLSISTLLKEIAKCQILCANCHRHKTRYGQEAVNAN
jgi:hypothetical protein